MSELPNDLPDMPQEAPPVVAPPQPASGLIDYDAPVKVRSLHGARILLETPLNGLLPTCPCHFVDGAGAVLHQGQVILMRRGEALGEPDGQGRMQGGRVGVDFELADAGAELYTVPTAT